VEFTNVTTREPHKPRRRALLERHPEIRALYGYDLRPAWITVGVVALQLALAAAIQRLAGSGVGGWRLLVSEIGLAMGIGAVLSHWAGVVIHEASHNLCAPTPRLNRIVALMANLHVPLPAAMSFFRYHLDHHAFMGIEGRDNDLPTPLERQAFSSGPVRKLAWLVLYPLFAALARGFMRRPSRWEVFGVVLQLTVDAVILKVLGVPALSYLLWSTLFGYGIHPVAGHFIHEHYLWNQDQETYSYYGPLNAVTWNIGYHNEHHDFVRVPGARLPQLHRIGKDVYGALASHRSWARVYWLFVSTSRLGHHSRFVRAPM
jgi:sphingolipid delta-4 desaturase